MLHIFFIFLYNKFFAYQKKKNNKILCLAQAGCMRQVLGPGALGRPRGIGWRGRWEGGSGWGIHVNPWLIHIYVWQKPVQCCRVISLQLIKKKRYCVYSTVMDPRILKGYWKPTWGRGPLLPLFMPAFPRSWLHHPQQVQSVFAPRTDGEWTSTQEAKIFNMSISNAS